jgi:hypothetical protein
MGKLIKNMLKDRKKLTLDLRFPNGFLHGAAGQIDVDVNAVEPEFRLHLFAVVLEITVDGHDHHLARAKKVKISSMFK